MPKVEININKNIYGFIDPNTGKEVTAEDFAKKYPGVSVGRPAVAHGYQKNSEINQGVKKI